MLHTITVRKILLVSTLAILWISTASFVSAGISNWANIGPQGGGVTALVIDPQTPTTLLRERNGIEMGWRLTLQHTDNGGLGQATVAGKVYCWKKLLRWQPIPPLSVCVCSAFVRLVFMPLLIWQVAFQGYL